MGIIISIALANVSPYLLALYFSLTYLLEDYSPLNVLLLIQPPATMSKLKWLLDKLATKSEPELTSAQMMLTNNDLRPGETRTQTPFISTPS